MRPTPPYTPPRHPHYTEDTTAYWQELITSSAAPLAPWKYSYPARLPSGKTLPLPIRPLAAPAPTTHAVASLLVNHASLGVVEQLGYDLSQAIKKYDADVIVALPTLGLTLAPAVARFLGHPRYIPLSTSLKFWYDPGLSAEVRSITSPGVPKKLYLDPNLVPLLRGRRVALIDDVVSTGVTLNASWDLLERLGCEVVVAGVVMKQGMGWVAVLGGERVARCEAVMESPLLEAAEGGWVERAEIGA